MTTRKTEFMVRRQPVRIEPDKKNKGDVEVMHSRLQADKPLALDDNEFGGDPYNSTGRFSALDPEKVRKKP